MHHVLCVCVCVQAVDMRWGVPAQANDDHTITDLCIEEIVNCQKYSIGPNFVVRIKEENILYSTHTCQSE